MKNWLILTVTGAFLMGCCSGVNGPPDRYELRLDPTMTPDQMALVLGAYNDWHREAGAETTPIVSSEPCWYHDGDTMGCIHVRYGTAADAAAVCGSAPGGYERAGCTKTESVAGYAWSAEIILTWHGDFTLDHEIALHEAGHSFGLHHDRAGTVMAASTDIGYPDITPLDIAQYHRVRNF